MANNDSKAQKQQELDNKARQGQGMDTNGDGKIDNKLDGPNRPAE